MDPALLEKKLDRMIELLEGMLREQAVLRAIIAGAAVAHDETRERILKQWT
jgi:hypothetical protein